MFNEIRNKELDIGELFSFAFHLFRENLFPIAMITIFLYVPIGILMNIVGNSIQQTASSIFMMNPVSDVEFVVGAKNLYIYYLIFILILVFIIPIPVIAISKVIQYRIEGKNIKYSQAILQSLEKGPSIVFTGIIFVVLMALSFMAFFIPAIYFGYCWIFYVYSIGLSDKNGLNALKHSRVLVKGRWIQTFGTCILLSLLMFALNYIISSFFFTESRVFIVDTIAIVFYYFIQSYKTVFMTIWFINRNSMIALKHKEFSDFETKIDEKYEIEEDTHDDKL